MSACTKIGVCTADGVTMMIIDPRGGMISESSHTVKTLDAAREWFANAKESDLPIEVTQSTTGNGRVFIRIKNNKGQSIYKRG